MRFKQEGSALKYIFSKDLHSPKILSPTYFKFSPNSISFKEIELGENLNYVGDNIFGECKYKELL